MRTPATLAGMAVIRAMTAAGIAPLHVATDASSGSTRWVTLTPATGASDQPRGTDGPPTRRCACGDSKSPLHVAGTRRAASRFPRSSPRSVRELLRTAAHKGNRAVAVAPDALDNTRHLRSTAGRGARGGHVARRPARSLMESMIRGFERHHITDLVEGYSTMTCARAALSLGTRSAPSVPR